MIAASAAGPRASTLERLRFPLLGVGAALALVAVAVADVLQGAAGLTPGVVLDAIRQPDGSVEHALVRDVRLPRAAAGIVAGAALAAAGVCFQTLTRNPLAEPGTLGVNAGAALALAAYVAFAPFSVGSFEIAVAFAGALGAALLVWLLAAALGFTPLRLLLAGTAITVVLGSATAAIQLLRENETSGLFFWGAGSLIQDGWSSVRPAAVLTALAIAALVLAGRALDVSLLGDDASAALGVRGSRLRAGAGLLGVLLAAVAVSVVGPFAFVGFVAPHLARLAGVRRTRPLASLSALLGGALVLAADVGARLLLGSAQEVPAGVFVALLGTPFLVALARSIGTGREVVARSPLAVARRLPRLAAFPAAVAALVGVVVVALASGDVDVPLRATVGALLGSSGDPLADVVVDLRWPRVAVAALAGACLAVSGAVLQAVVRNPLAGPELTGVIGGASLAAITVLVALPAVDAAVVPLAALLGAAAAFAVVLLCAGGLAASPARLALVGVAVSAACAGLVGLITATGPLRASLAVQWLAGTSYGRASGDALRLAYAAVPLLLAAWLAARPLDLFGVGDDAARSLGLRVARARLMLLAVGTALGAVAVSTVGAVSFAGLLAPHAARLLVGVRARHLVPMSALVGATAVTAADLIGRAAFAPVELPMGIVVAFLGTPFLLVALLLSRRRNAAAAA